MNRNDLICTHCGTKNKLPEKDEPRAAEMTGFRCGDCHKDVEICAHPNMPILRRGNPVSFKQCSDCQRAVFWDDGWRSSHIKLPPNASDEERAACFLAACSRIPKSGYREEVALKNRRSGPINCPHCGKINEWSPDERTTCAHCERGFSVKVGMRFRVRGGASLPLRKRAWKMFAEGKKPREVAEALKMRAGSMAQWHMLWRSGVEM